MIEYPTFYPFRVRRRAGERMNTVLDLIGEFGVLNDAKGIWGGKLPPEAEQRWEELKSFYDLLMSKNGVGPRPVTRRFTAREVEEKVTARERLRVPLEHDMFFRADSEFHTAMGVNLSRGGLFVTSPLILPGPYEAERVPVEPGCLARSAARGTSGSRVDDERHARRACIEGRYGAQRPRRHGRDHQTPRRLRYQLTRAPSVGYRRE